MNESVGETRGLRERQRAAVRDMQALIADRAEAEVRIKQTCKSASDSIERETQEKRKAIDQKYQAEKRETERTFRARAKEMKHEFETELSRLELEYETSLARIAEKAEHNEVAAKKALDEAVWLAETVYEATEAQPIEQYQQICKGIDGKLLDLQTTQEQAESLLKKYRQRVPPPLESSNPPDVNSLTAEHINAVLDERLDHAKSEFDRLRSMFIPRLFQGMWPLFFVFVIALIGVVIGAALNNWQVTQNAALHAGAGVIAAVAIMAGLYFIAKSRMARHYRDLREQVVIAHQIADRGRALAAHRRDQQAQQLIEKRDADLREAREKHEPIVAEINERRAHHIARIHEKYPKLISDHKETFERHKNAVDTEFQNRMGEMQRQYNRDMHELLQRYTDQNEAARTQYDFDWNALEHRWNSGMTRVYETLREAKQECDRLFLDWYDPAWQQWDPPRESAPIIRFGEQRINLAQIPGGIPQDERLIIPGPTDFTIPALLAFPEPCSMLIQAGNHGRDEAVRVLQTAMFRLLCAIPPGKARFTIIDPVGLGQNFAGFMHLADYDGAYVTDKIWTEDRHIEQRLLDLTEHMENVIQKYLRNEYETISEYNIDAGEIAEPFRFLVIANFPVNFSETAARRLASIVNSGARCGVYTLITVDSRQALPPGIQLSDLDRNCVRLNFDKDRFVMADPDLAPFPLRVDDPPNEDFLTEKLHIIGEAAKDTSRVEVPFDVIAPPPDQLWTGDTTNDLRIALGRAGATKLQYLTLGVGTSQHALIAGKTGSGKSTLLHALITNLSLWYSPDEVEFYLVDFKKGVEFKTYAAHQLPHARAVAIESDREFGLSVLQRLDAELKHRGNLYRDLGVQDLAGYRRTGHPEKLPRILLIVDEFQELFIEDDKIAQDAALLLDRLVRQGRAFGIHVILGSQTLGGAYSLARSTIGQMGVRIALQCSEADSYLILSDDNAAARLLSRPGEAIYNDASGMVEGNNPFQIVWLPDEKREKCLNRVRDKANEHHFRRKEAQIVFEGNVPAEISRNLLLENAVESPASQKAPAVATAYLGEAIAIKDPTAAEFRRQSGNNLMIIGQREEAALAMLATAMLSLASQHVTGNIKFYILDGSPADASTAGYLERVASQLPHQVCNVGWRDVPSAMNEIAQDLAQRTSSDASASAPAIFILIYGLQRFRMLRQEDDFGFSSSSDPDEPPKPDKQFATILREGPHSGIHTIAWCDTASNLNRSLDRQGLKEFENRVLFQMGASDSSNLIDTPIAFKLGMHRALFFSEEHGHLEKFRPYALPDEQWLRDFAERLKRKKA